MEAKISKSTLKNPTLTGEKCYFTFYISKYQSFDKHLSAQSTAFGWHDMKDDPPAVQSHSEPPTPATLTLGSFRIQTVLGSGGEGVVWLGQDLVQGKRPVAIKIMSARYGADPVYRARFYAEVRAMASLTHPRIAAILDYGLVSEEASAQSEGVLSTGSPYLVIEYAPGGPLQSVLPVQNFQRARTVILQVLEGLAHAHARGLVHRDIKPGNILLLDRHGADPGVLLTDFGIVFATGDPAHRAPDAAKRTLRLWQDQTGFQDEDESLAVVSAQAGTPAYMAPEQIHGDLANIGPWTDLYALGCVAYRMITGHTPFYGFGPEVRNILHAHLQAAVPPLKTMFPVPDGLQEWFSIMLAKAPWERFQRAADAAEALCNLDIGITAVPLRVPPQPSEAHATGRGFGEDPDSSLTEDERPTSPELPREDSPTVSDVSLRRQDAALPGADRPVGSLKGNFPADWRSVETSRRDQAVTRAGLNLFGLRDIPLVGREEERSLLWKTLDAVISGQQSFFVAVHGPAGVGKSRLVRWLCETADEIGWAEVFTATHSPFAGGADGIGAMLARTLRCQGLTPHDMFRQTRHVLQALGSAEDQTDEDLDFLAMALAELMASQAGSGRKERHPPTGLLTNQDARFAVVTEFLRRKARHRPVLLWLDDVQWGLDSLGLASFLMKNAGSSPILVLSTYRDEELPDRPREAAALEKLSKLRHAVDLSVSPLDVSAQSALIRRMVDLDEDVIEEMVQRTGAYPLYAVQLIADWLDGGLLRDSGHGLVLAKEATTGIPDDIYAMWHHRIQRMEDRFGRTALSAIEIAAALGTEVHAQDWVLACRQSGVPIPEGLQDWLIETGLVRQTERGWTFIHPMFRESLERHAKEEGRWQAAHLACALALAQHYGEEASEWSGDIGRHFFTAGAMERAVTPLLQAAERASLKADFSSAIEDIDLAETCLDRLDSAQRNTFKERADLLRAEVLFRKGDFDHAQELLENILTANEMKGPVTQAKAWRAKARILRMRGKLLEARQAAENGAKAFRSLGKDSDAATCDVILARLHFESTGNHEIGLKLAQSAEALFRKKGDEANLAETQYIEALLLLAVDRQRQAVSLTKEARIRYGRVGNRFGEAACENFLGEVARQGHRFKEAVNHYRRAAKILQSIGSDWTHVQRINMALTLVQSKHYAAAQKILEGLLDQKFGMKAAVSCYIDYALLVCSANNRDWSAWDEQFQQAFGARPATGRVDRDLAELALLAARKAAKAGHRDRAKRAVSLSKEHWKALGDESKIRECENLVGSLCDDE